MMDRWNKPTEEEKRHYIWNGWIQNQKKMNEITLEKKNEVRKTVNAEKNKMWNIKCTERNTEKDGVQSRMTAC